MRRLASILLFALCLAACKKGHDDGGSSYGNINEISIVISDALWNGEVGDSLRKKLAAPVDGLPQEEPLFTLNQLHDKSFDGDLKKGRNIIVVEKSGKKGFHFRQNRFCAPQNVFAINGRSLPELLEMIEMHGDEIIRTIRQTEITWNQKRNKKAGLLNTQEFAKVYGITMDVPLGYSYALQGDGFVWLKKDIPGGNTNILIYRVPDTMIEKNKTPAANIINVRDSIGRLYIHGQDPDTYMVTEEAYSPYLFMTSFKDRPAFESRGNWEMANDFMGGPYLNYAIRDHKHGGYLIIEGFIYSPSSPKRELIVELESIIKSVKFL